MINIPKESKNIREQYLQAKQEGYVLDQYWKLVSLTISEILYPMVQNYSTHINHDLNELKREIENLQTLVESRPIEEQMLFYHAEPLDVAMDVLDLKPSDVPEDHINEYIALANKYIGNLDDFSSQDQ